MTFAGYRMDRTLDRRIGRRVRAPDLPVTWVPPRRGGLRLRRRPRTWPGHITNVSVTGAAVTGPVDLPVALGDVVVLEWDGLPNHVRVRWVEATEEPGLALYGLELLAVQPRLRTAIHRLLDDAPPPRR